MTAKILFIAVMDRSCKFRCKQRGIKPSEIQTVGHSSLILIWFDIKYKGMDVNEP